MNDPGAFPRTRLRRNRRDAWSRRLVRENHLSASDLVWPIFVREGVDDETPVAAMPGVSRLTIDRAAPADKREALKILRERLS